MMLSNEDKEILDIYNSLSDDELMQLSDDEFAEFDSLTTQSEAGPTTDIPATGVVSDEQLSLEPDVGDVPMYEPMSDEESVRRTQSMVGGHARPGFDPVRKAEAIREVEEGGLSRGLTSGVEVGAEILGDIMPGGEPVQSPGEYASLFGERMQVAPEDAGFVGGITRSPSFVPSMMIPFGAVARGIGAGASKIPMVGTAVANAMNKAPAFLQKGIQAGTEGALEEVSTGLIEGDLSGEQALFGAGVSGVAGGVGGKVAEKAFDKFKNVLPKSMIDRLGGIEKADDKLRDTYAGLKGYGALDYDLEGRLRTIKSEQARLGQLKEQAYTEAKKIAPLDATLGATAGTVRDFDNESARVIDEISTRGMSADAGAEYLEKLADIKRQYFDKIDDHLPTTPDVLGTSGEVGKVANMLRQVSERASVKPTGRASLSAKAMGLDLEDDILKLFNARKAMDVDLERAYSKQQRGVKLPSVDKAYMFGRTQLNKQIDETIKQVRVNLKKTGDKGSLDALNKLTKELDRTKELPSLYKQEEILRSIGGGRAGGGIRAITKNDAMQSLFPTSGKRERQIGEALASPFVRRTAKEAAYRRNDESPLFGPQGVR